MVSRSIDEMSISDRGSENEISHQPSMASTPTILSKNSEKTSLESLVYRSWESSSRGRIEISNISFEDSMSGKWSSTISFHHPTIDPQGKILKTRPYQEQIFESCIEKNKIVVMPTGSGKTVVAILLMARLIRTSKQPVKILFLADRQAIVEQQKNEINQYISQLLTQEEREQTMITAMHGGSDEGAIPDMNNPIIQSYNVILVCSSGLCLKLLRRGLITFEKLNLIALDECHEATNEYHYFSLIMSEFYHRIPTYKPRPRILGLTATPIKREFENQIEINLEVEKLCGQLDCSLILNDDLVEESRRTLTTTTLVRGYTTSYSYTKKFPNLQSRNRSKKKGKKWQDQTQDVSSAELQNLCDKMQLVKELDDAQLKIYGESDGGFIKFFEKLRKDFQFVDAKDEYPDLKRIITSFQNKLLAIYLELGTFAMTHYFDYITNKTNHEWYHEDENLKAEENKKFFNQCKIIEILRDKLQSIDEMQRKKQYNSKVTELMDILATKVSPEKSNVAIVFVGRKYLAKLVSFVINSFAKDKNLPIKSGYVVGARKTKKKKKLVSAYGDDEIDEDFEDRKSRKPKVLDENIMINHKRLLSVSSTFKEQMTTIDKFRKSQINVLVATSVVEEGFDIPECNLVISFQEPQSLTKIVQLRGRARQAKSTYAVLTSLNSVKAWEHRTLFAQEYVKEIVSLANHISKTDPYQFESTMKHLREQMSNHQYIERGTGDYSRLNTNWSQEFIRDYTFEISSEEKPRYYTFSYVPYRSRKRTLTILRMPKDSPIGLAIGKIVSKNRDSIGSATLSMALMLIEKGYINQNYGSKFNSKLQGELYHVINWQMLAAITECYPDKRNDICEKITKRVLARPIIGAYLKGVQPDTYIGYIYLLSNIGLNSNQVKNEKICMVLPTKIDEHILESLKEFNPEMKLIYAEKVIFSKEEYKTFITLHRYLLLTSRDKDLVFFQWFGDFTLKSSALHKTSDSVPLLSFWEFENDDPNLPFLTFFQSHEKAIDKRRIERCLNSIKLYTKFTEKLSTPVSDRTEDYPVLEQTREKLNTIRTEIANSASTSLILHDLIRFNKFKKTNEAAEKTYFNNGDKEAISHSLGFDAENFINVTLWIQKDLYRIPRQLLTSHPLEADAFKEIDDFKSYLQEINKKLKCYEIYTQLTKKNDKQKYTYKYTPPQWISEKFAKQIRYDYALETKEVPTLGNLSERAWERIFEALDILKISDSKKNHPLFFLGDLLLSFFFSVDCFLNQQLCHLNFLRIQKSHIFNESSIFKKALDSGFITHFYTDEINEFVYAGHGADFTELWKQSLKFVQLVSALVYLDSKNGFGEFWRILSNLGFSSFPTSTISFDCTALNLTLEENNSFSGIFQELETKLRYEFKNRSLLLQALISDGFANLYFDKLLEVYKFEDWFSRWKETTTEKSKRKGMRKFTDVDPFDDDAYNMIKDETSKLNNLMSGEIGNERLVFLGKNLYNLVAAEFYRAYSEFDELKARSFVRQANKSPTMQEVIEKLDLSRIKDVVSSRLGVTVTDTKHKESIRTKGLYALYGAILLDNAFSLTETIEVVRVICNDQLKKLLSSNYWESDPIYILEKKFGPEEIKIEREPTNDYTKQGQYIYNLFVRGVKVVSKMGRYFSKIEEGLYEDALKDINRLY